MPRALEGHSSDHIRRMLRAAAAIKPGRVHICALHGGQFRN
jgi:hypothetical protein